MSSQRQRPSNVHSILLQDAENETLFQMLGHSCATIATGVIQLYLADQADRSRWSKRCCGVACLIRDGSKRSYYIRVYDIKKQQMIWEQELYNHFTYKTPRDYFHTFEGDTCQAGLNFASEDEAIKFKKAMEIKLNERLEKKLDRKRQTMAQKSRSNRPLNAPNKTAASPRSPPATELGSQSNISINSNNSSGGTLKKDKDKDKKKDAKKKLTKADIGTPSNFRHVSHVGWDPDKGFDMKDLEPDMQMLFQSVGITDDVDKDTVEFIYDFVEKNGGIDAVKKDLSLNKAIGQQRPPPPSRNNTSAPPPPPARTAAPPPPPPSRSVGPPPPPPPSRDNVFPSGRGAAPPPPSRGMPPPPRAPASAPPAPPPPPPAMSAAPPPPPPPPPAGGPPPPPPPPPPMAGGGMGGAGRGALLESIRSGTQLRHAEPTSTNEAPADSRDQLMDAIRQGANLKKVDDADRQSVSSPEEMGGLVGALAKALASRRPACANSDDEDDSDDDDDDVSDVDEWDD